LEVSPKKLPSADETDPSDEDSGGGR